MQTFSKLYKSRSLPSQRETSKVRADFFASNTRILPKKLQKNTHPTNFFSQSSHNCSQLLTLINEQRFTESLEYLERLGCTGDAGIFVLANLQEGGAA